MEIVEERQNKLLMFLIIMIELVIEKFLQFITLSAISQISSSETF
jgi:hypothetical protein